MLRRFGYLALILCIALTSIGLGVARGTVMIAGQIVLCTGEGVVVVDHPEGAGGPVQAHVCPDMALSLLAGTVPDTAVLPDGPGYSSTLAMGWQNALVSRDVPGGIARAPPTL